ncbi:MAG: hypothetical protein LBH19_08440, partial [Dysgonamonadaceae bacterium]|nr:hypothetical protein [Dysgonamonadaceae bacterium]
MKQKFYMLFAAILVSCMAALGQTPNSNGSRNMQKAGEEAFIQLHIDKLKADITLTINQETEIREL